MGRYNSAGLVLHGVNAVSQRLREASHTGG